MTKPLRLKLVLSGCVLAIGSLGLMIVCCPLSLPISRSEDTCAKIPVMTRYCGVSSVKAISELFGYSFKWQEIARLVQPDKNGASSFADLKAAFARLGLFAVGVECDFESLADLNTPAVLLLEDDMPAHFVVCARIQNGQAEILEIPRPSRKMREADLREHWKNKAMAVFSDARAIPLHLRERIAGSETTGLSEDTSLSGKPKHIGSLVFGFSELDLGVLPRFSPISAAIPCVNKGEYVVQLTTVKTSCRCVSTVDYPKKLAPGESGSIRVVIDPKSDIGLQRKELYVTTDETGPAKGNIDIIFTIKKDMWLSSTQLDFGSHIPEEIQVQTLHIFNAYRGSGRICRVETDPALITLSPPRYLDKACVQSEIDIRLSDSAPVGNLSTEVKFYFQGAEDHPLSVPVLANILGRVTFSPPKVAFGMVDLDKVTSRTLRIRINQALSDRLSASMFKSDTGEIQIHLLEVSPNDSTLQLELKPTSLGHQLHEGNIQAILPDDITFAVPYSYFVNVR